MAKQLELRVLLDVDFDHERTRLKAAWGKNPQFLQTVLEFIDAIEAEDQERVTKKWNLVEKNNPDPETRAIEYIDPSIVTYWMGIAKEKKVLLTGREAIEVFDQLRNDASWVKSPSVQIKRASLEIGNAPDAP